MKRRDFLKTGFGAGLLATGAFSVLDITKSVASENDIQAYDLVAVKGGSPEVMFDKAIAQLGGMSNYVKRGQTVVVKPNIGWDATPERAANTNPDLVGRIVKRCKEAGASRVYVFDNTCDDWNSCYKNSGIEAAVKANGGTIITGNSERDYREVSIPKGKKLKKAKVHEKILDSDVFINVPVLKNHGGAKMTISMKNLMGIVWDRRWWHRNDLHQCIADFATYRKPDLNVVDAYRVMKRNGPRGRSVADVATYKSLLVSTDMVAADTAATKLFGMAESSVKYIGIAHNMGVGNKNLGGLKIKRLYL